VPPPPPERILIVDDDDSNPSDRQALVCLMKATRAFEAAQRPGSALDMLDEVRPDLIPARTCACRSWTAGNFARRYKRLAWGRNAARIVAFYRGAQRRARMRRPGRGPACLQQAV